jgi:hypothetical protein
MDEQNETHESVEKKDITDAEILIKVGYSLKVQYRKLIALLDVLHMSFGMRIVLLILLFCNLYILSFHIPFISFILLVVPYFALPFYLYGIFIEPGIWLLNILTATLLIMRYRQHKIIFYGAITVFVLSLILFLSDITPVVTYFMYFK